MAWGGLPPLPHLQQQGTHSLGMALISSGAVWDVWDSRENCCQMSLITGNLARSMFLADGSFLLLQYS